MHVEVELGPAIREAKDRTMYIHNGIQFQVLQWGPSDGKNPPEWVELISYPNPRYRLKVRLSELVNP